MVKKIDTIKAEVHFGNLSVGDETVKIPIAIDRHRIGLAAVDRNFCNAQLSVTMTVIEDPNQQYFDGMKPKPLAAAAECRSYSVNAKRFSARLIFQLVDIQLDNLAKFAKSAAKIEVTRTGEIPTKDGEDDE